MIEKYNTDCKVNVQKTNILTEQQIIDDILNFLETIKKGYKNRDKITLIIKSLYDYQQEALRAAILEKKGKVILPTGTGKTRIQAALIAINILMNDKKFEMYVINAPRIMLSYQLLREVYSFLVKFGLETRYMCVHSGGQTDIRELEEIRADANKNLEDNVPYSDIANGTSTEIIKEMIQKASSQKLPLIFFSTYNSCDRIEKSLIGAKKIEIVVNDECQYLVQERFFDIHKILKPNRCFFFTATEKFSESIDGRGMNNEKIFGKSLYTMTPMEAISKGKMVRPRMHFVRLKNQNLEFNKDEFENSIPNIIQESFKQHQYVCELRPKMLVSVTGTKDMVKFLKSKEYSYLRDVRGVHIYMVSSNDAIGNNINGEKTTRQDFLKRLKIDGEDPSKELIVLHFDIIAEGIDISGFTGIMPLRELSDSKFFQTYGRSARLDPRDRKNLEDGLLNPQNVNDFIKKYAWVIIPEIIHENKDSKEHIGSLIHKMRDFGFNPIDDIVISNDANGLPTIDGPEALNKLKKRCPNIGKNIEEVEAEYEDERIASLSMEDYIKEIFN